MGSGQDLRGAPHCHTEFTNQLGPLVRLLQTETLILKHLASAHTNTWEKPVGLKLLQPTKSFCPCPTCSKSPTTPWQFGAGSGGRYGQHALHLHHQWWKGSTQRKEGFHLQSHTSDLESQQVDHVNESRVRQCSKRQEAEFNKGTTRGRLLTGHFAHDIAKKHVRSLVTVPCVLQSPIEPFLAQLNSHVCQACAARMCRKRYYRILPPRLKLSIGPISEQSLVCSCDIGDQYLK